MRIEVTVATLNRLTDFVRDSVLQKLNIWIIVNLCKRIF